MYQEYYQLSDDPFRLNSDAHSACLHQQLRQTLKRVVDAIKKGAGVVYVTGRTGIGKTMLLKSLTEDQHGFSVLLKTTARQINDKGLVSLLMDSEGTSHTEQPDWLSAYELILDKQDNRKVSLLCIDDAHELTEASLIQVGEAVKLIEVRGYQVCFVLAGNNKIKPPESGFPPQLLVATQLNAINHNEMDDYVQQRLKVVGGDGSIQFDESIWEYLFQLTEGVPRRINRICNRLLLNGMFDEKRHFNKDDMLVVARQLDKEGLLELTPETATELDLVGTNPETMDVRPVLDMKAFYQAYQSTQVKSAQKAPQKAVVPPVLNDTVLLNTQVLPEVDQPAKAEEPLVLFTDETDFQHTFETEKEARNWMLPLVFLLALTGLIIFAAMMIYSFIDADFINDKPAISENTDLSSDDSPNVIAKKTQAPGAVSTQSTGSKGSEMTELEVPLIAPPSEGNIVVDQPAKTRNSSFILSASLYKALLQDNHWQKNYKPAVLLPSVLNECNSSGDDIYCLTRTRQSKSKDILYSYQTGAMIQGFSDDGTFFIMYRSSITRTENPDFTNLDLDSSLKVPLDTKERRMQCEFITGTMIKCTENRMVSIYTRQFPKQSGGE